MPGPENENTKIKYVSKLCVGMSIDVSLEVILFLYQPSLGLITMGHGTFCFEGQRWVC